MCTQDQLPRGSSHSYWVQSCPPGRYPVPGTDPRTQMCSAYHSRGTRVTRLRVGNWLREAALPLSGHCAAANKGERSEALVCGEGRTEMPGTTVRTVRWTPGPDAVTQEQRGLRTQVRSHGPSHSHEKLPQWRVPAPRGLALTCPQYRV